MSAMTRALLIALLPAVAALSSSGCFLAAVAGAGAEGGYVAGQKDRSASQTMEDQLIHTKVKAALLAAEGVPSGRVDVTVREGVVTLRGLLDDDGERRRALAAARVQGAKKIVDGLVVSPRK